ncbi:MAG: hypothetical protein NW208_17665 [Bryobacter sp.]|nr:hypothetical protein [Bryobacter sp.]
MEDIACRIGCGACCIVPSISSPIPGLLGETGLPAGKPAFTRCVQLDEANRCRLFGSPERPAVCSSLRPQRQMCGDTDQAAWDNLVQLELGTRPAAANVVH